MNLPRVAAPTRRLACALALMAAAGGAAADILVQTGTNCRSTGATTETSAGERINDTYGTNPGDYVTYTCPVVWSRNLYSAAVTVKVIGATNSRTQQSFCMLRSVSDDGTVYHEDQSGYFATNNSAGKLVSTVTMTANVKTDTIANALTLRCRLASTLPTAANEAPKPKNSIIMYWVEQ